MLFKRRNERLDKGGINTADWVRKSCVLGSGDKVQPGRWVIKMAWCGSGARPLRQCPRRAAQEQNCPALPSSTACYTGFCPQTKGWEPEEISERSYQREHGVKCTSDSWGCEQLQMVYLSRRWRGLLGLSLKFCMTWRILKRPHCALTTAGQKIWKTENQKNSNCKCPNHEGNIRLEWITKDVVNSPALGVKKKDTLEFPQGTRLDSEIREWNVVVHVMQEARPDDHSGLLWPSEIWAIVVARI